MAQSVLEKSFIPVEYFYEGELIRDAEGNPVITPAGETIPDFYPAICRAQALPAGVMSVPVHHPSFDFPPLEGIPGTYDSGAAPDHHPFLRIVFRPVTYHFSHTIEIVRPVHLLGAGQYSTFGTVFAYPPNKAGIIVHGTRGGQLTTHLLTDEHGNYIRSADGNVKWGATTINAPSYLSPSLVNRRKLGDMFERPAATGGFDWTKTNFEKTHGINTIIEGINLRGTIEYMAADGQFSNSPYDIFPDMQVVLNPVGNDANGDVFQLFDPYENHNRTCNWEGTESLARIPPLEDITRQIDSGAVYRGYSSLSHACRAAHGITAFIRVAIRDCTIENFAGHGVYFFGNNYGGVVTCSEIRNTMVQNCCGNGYHFYGQDTSNIVFIGNQAKAVEGWGVANIVTNSCNTILSSVFHTCVKGSFVCTPQVYINGFQVEQLRFAPRERSFVFREITNRLQNQALLIIGSHAEGGSYDNFPGKRPLELFMITDGPPVLTEDGNLYDIIPFDGSTAEKDSYLDRICKKEVNILNMISLLIGGATGNLTNTEGYPMVVGTVTVPASANIVPA